MRNASAPMHIVESHIISCKGVNYYSEELVKSSNPQFWIYVGVSVLLVLTAGLMSGLTIGLMSLDSMNVEILQNSGTEKQKRYATRVLPLLKQHHLLLVTLLLVNAAANEALPLFLDRLLSPVATVIVSVTAVLMFGEIIPQAVCQRHSLSVGASMTPLVWIIIAVMFPIAWPIAKLLDGIMGTERSNYYRRAELKELVQMHSVPNHHTGEHSHRGDLTEMLSSDECLIIRGALDLKNKTAEQCMTPIEKVVMVDYMATLDLDALHRIAQCGHSRLPVYIHTKENVIGMLLVKSLVGIDPNHPPAVRELQVRRLPIVSTNKPLYDMLNLFQLGKSHMAMVVDPKDHLTYRGIITLENVIEELIQEPIVDETDGTFGTVASRIEGGERARGKSMLNSMDDERSPLLAAPHGAIHMPYLSTSTSPT